MELQKIEGAITAVAGFETCGLHTNLKRKRKDACLIFCEGGFDWAACFTRNLVKAHPVVWDMKRLANYQKAKAIYINSGNANACVGRRGERDVLSQAEKLADLLQIEQQECLLSSTGVIGVPLDMERIERSMGLCVEHLSRNGGEDAAEAILTTDTFSKSGAFRFKLGNVPITIGYMAKGSGMIHPNMGTMLAYVTTDVSIEPSVLQEILTEAVDKSFNRITVDGDTSTNDSVFVMTTQRAGNPKITTRQEAETFYQYLLYALKDMAHMIVEDGEGATKFIDVAVYDATSEEEAVSIAKSVATSSLVKTAMYGEDANWGRVLCAIGYAGVDVDPAAVKIAIGDILLYDGEGVVFSEEQAKEVLEKKEIEISISLGRGTYRANVWTCDFSTDYVKINGSYRS